MLLTFAVARAKGVHRLVDIAWGAAFAAVALAGYGMSAGQGDDGRRFLATGATVLWGLRLSAHIARRGRGHGEDPAMTACSPGPPAAETPTPCAWSICFRPPWCG